MSKSTQSAIEAPMNPFTEALATPFLMLGTWHVSAAQFWTGWAEFLLGE